MYQGFRMHSIPWHIAPGAREVHHWVYQILAILIILGLWVALAGYAERRRAANGSSDDRTDAEPSREDARNGQESRRYVNCPAEPEPHSPRRHEPRR